MHKPPVISLEFVVAWVTFAPSNPLLSLNQEKFKYSLLSKDPGESALFLSGEFPESVHDGQEMGGLDNFSTLFSF